jgi:hypothetical protein
MQSVCYEITLRFSIRCHVSVEALSGTQYEEKVRKRR